MVCTEKEAVIDSNGGFGRPQNCQLRQERVAKTLTELGSAPSADNYTAVGLGSKTQRGPALCQRLASMSSMIIVRKSGPKTVTVSDTASALFPDLVVTN